ncbi:MAG: hypothetical protein KGJ18_09125 [Gammaproteobacteria bacterium]|nr:hypothetical protein [Gammaproteobacteria bacterium]
MRIYFVDAGPDLWSSFHVIGAMFDKIYPDGDVAHALSGVSTYTVGPGAGAIFDLVIPEPGKYAFVDHDMAHAMIGAIGVFEVHAPGAPPLPAPVSVASPVTPQTVASAPAAALEPAGHRQRRESRTLPQLRRRNLALTCAAPAVQARRPS